jgi:ABC-type antimicrobial peptide transport system permease subunit
MKFSYLGAELLHRPRRSLAAILSMAFGVALLLSLQAYSSGYRKAARAPLAEIGADIAAQRQGKVPEAFQGILFPHSTAPIHRGEIDAIRGIPGVEDVGEAVFFWDFETDKSFLVVLGIDPSSRTGPSRLMTALLAGRFLNEEDHDVAVADSTWSKDKNLAIGSTVAIAGRSFKIIGLVDTSKIGQVANANLYITVSDARALAHDAKNVMAVHDYRPDDANILFIKANQAQVDSVSKAVGSVLGSQALISSAQSFSEVISQAYVLVDRFSWLVGLAGFLVAVVGLLRATSSALHERRRDIGLMRAVGWSRGNVLAQLTSEAASLAGLGALVGLGLAALASSALSTMRVSIPVPWELSPTPHFAPGGAVPMAVNITLSARIELVPVALAVGSAIFCGLLVGLLVSRRATHIRPAEVLRSE